MSPDSTINSRRGYAEQDDQAHENKLAAVVDLSTSARTKTFVRLPPAKKARTRPIQAMGYAQAMGVTRLVVNKVEVLQANTKRRERHQGNPTGEPKKKTQER